MRNVCTKTNSFILLNNDFLTVNNKLEFPGQHHQIFVYPVTVFF